MSLDHFKKQASSFLHERVKMARLVFTDVTHAELLAEEATNKDPCSPDAKTMAIIADASFELVDYWRIVDVLHNRLRSVEWKQWKQSYKSLVLLEFLLTHGPEEFAAEFRSDSYIIEELGTFKHIDERGFNWGEIMQKKSERILHLLKGGQTLQESRLRALKITREIQGFGSSSSSSSSSLSTLSPTYSPNFSPNFSYSSSTNSSSGSYSATTSPTWSDLYEENIFEKSPSPDDALESHTWEGMGNENRSSLSNMNIEVQHLWDYPPTEEDDCLLETEYKYKEEKPSSYLGGVRSKLVALSPTRSERTGFRKAYDKSEENRSFGPYSSSTTSSFGSYSATTSPTWSDLYEENRFEKSPSPDNESHSSEVMANANSSSLSNMNIEGQHLWDYPPTEEDDGLLETKYKYKEDKPSSFLRGFCSKLAALSPTRAERTGFRKAYDKSEE